MTTNRFLQFHTLTSYSASLLNRDDAGFAKRMPFGGAMRTRISSQCLKRHWRVHEGEHGLAAVKVPDSIRSRVTFEEHVVKPLIASGTNATVARGVARELVDVLLGSKQKKEKQEKQAKGSKKAKEAAAPAEKETTENADAVKTDQVIVLGTKELAYLFDLAKTAIAQGGGDEAAAVKAIRAALESKDLVKNIRAIAAGAGLSAALFGRFVTGDVLANVDAAIHVAHAMTVHSEASEADYFSALDEILTESGETGSGHINSSELTTGLFYGYVTVDVPGLIANLGGDKSLASATIRELVHMLPTVSPGAKKGGTAPYAYSHLLLAEAGNAQPRTLANAFLAPVPTTGNVLLNAYDALNGYAKELKQMYGSPETRVLAGMHVAERLNDVSTTKKPVAEIAEWAAQQVQA